jgi:hypothetical protein
MADLGMRVERLHSGRESAVEAEIDAIASDIHAQHARVEPPLSLRERVLVAVCVFAVVALVCAFWLSIAVVIVRWWGL